MSTPPIPKRPQKKEATEPSASQSESIEEPEHHAVEIVPTEESDTVLNSQTNDDDNNDGDKTPGNSDTKATFKTDLPSDSELAGSDASSFDDDQETVQDQAPQDDEELEQIQQDNDRPQSEPEIDSTSDAASSNNPENFSKQEVPDVMPIIPKRPKKKDNESDFTKSAKETESDAPVIPRRPKKKAMGTELKESGDEDSTLGFEKAKLSAVDDSNTSFSAFDEAEQTSITAENKGLPSEDDKNEAPEETEETEKYDALLATSVASKPTSELQDASSREDPVSSGETISSIGEQSIPSKVSEDTQPRIPERPKPKSLPSEEKPEKRPPPKPKKLSSKIAAFQEMLNQPKQDTPPVTNQGSSRGKLSNDKMKFAANLQGLVGRGFALPGMIDPTKLKPSDADESKDDDNKTQSVGTEETDTSQTKPPVVRRAKGPRGKRLPKTLSEPVNLTRSHFKIVQHDLWSVSFTKKEVKEKESTLNDQGVPEEEDLPGDKGIENERPPSEVTEGLERKEVLEVENASVEKDAHSELEVASGTSSEIPKVAPHEVTVDADAVMADSTDGQDEGIFVTSAPATEESAIEVNEQIPVSGGEIADNEEGTASEVDAPDVGATLSKEE